MADKSLPKPVATLRAWFVRVWRWWTEVYPAPIAVAIFVWIAFYGWLTAGHVRDVETALLAAFGVAVLTMVVALTMAWWHGRRARKGARDV